MDSSYATILNTYIHIYSYAHILLYRISSSVLTGLQTYREWPKLLPKICGTYQFFENAYTHTCLIIIVYTVSICFVCIHAYMHMGIYVCMFIDCIFMLFLIVCQVFSVSFRYCAPFMLCFTLFGTFICA